MYRMSIRTTAKVEFQDITSKVQEMVASSSINSGICHIFVPHTTAAVTVNEHADPSVVDDITAQLNSMIPQHNKYLHMEGNSPAHIKATLMGTSETLFVDGGKLVLGTWQGVFSASSTAPEQEMYW